MLRTIPRLGHVLVGWLAVGVFLYVSWRIPRLPFVLDVVGRLPSWAIVGGAGAWCIAILGLVVAGLMPQRASARADFVLGSLSAAILLVVFPIYLLSRGEGWQGDFGLAIGFIWVVCVLVDKFAFLVRARAKRRQDQENS